MGLSSLFLTLSKANSADRTTQWTSVGTVFVTQITLSTFMISKLKPFSFDLIEILKLMGTPAR